jgi:hypothetical protein
MVTQMPAVIILRVRIVHHDVLMCFEGRQFFLIFLEVAVCGNWSLQYVNSII